LPSLSTCRPARTICTCPTRRSSDLPRPAAGRRRAGRARRARLRRFPGGAAPSGPAACRTVPRLRAPATRERRAPSSAQDPPRAQIARLEVAIVEFRLDHAMRGARVDEPPARDIDHHPHVRDATSTGVEEHQVALPQLVRAHGVAGGVLLARYAWNPHGHFAVRGHGQSGAIDAAVAEATPDI